MVLLLLYYHNKPLVWQSCAVPISADPLTKQGGQLTQRHGGGGSHDAWFMGSVWMLAPRGANTWSPRVCRIVWLDIWTKQTSLQHFSMDLLIFQDFSCRSLSRCWRRRLPRSRTRSATRLPWHTWTAKKLRRPSWITWARTACWLGWKMMGVMDCESIESIDFDREPDSKQLEKMVPDRLR